MTTCTDPDTNPYSWGNVLHNVKREGRLSRENARMNMSGGICLREIVRILLSTQAPVAIIPINCKIISYKAEIIETIKQIFSHWDV